MRAEDALQAAAADAIAAKVESALKDIEQAGRGLVKVLGQLRAGVPKGNEVGYLLAVAGYVNSAASELLELAIPPAAPEKEGPKLVLG